MYYPSVAWPAGSFPSSQGYSYYLPHTSLPSPIQPMPATPATPAVPIRPPINWPPVPPATPTAESIPAVGKAPAAPPTILTPKFWPPKPPAESVPVSLATDAKKAAGAVLADSAAPPAAACKLPLPSASMLPPPPASLLASLVPALAALPSASRLEAALVTADCRLSDEADEVRAAKARLTMDTESACVAECEGGTVPAASVPMPAGASCAEARLQDQLAGWTQPPVLKSPAQARPKGDLAVSATQPSEPDPVVAKAVARALEELQQQHAANAI
eukprot:4022030-Prymnesium_polylepis.1